MIIYINCLGNFIFDDKLKLLDKKLFSPNEAIGCFKEEIDNVLLARYKELRKPTEQELEKILAFFRSSQFFKQFKENNTAITVEKIKHYVNEDHYILNTINNIEEVERTANALTKRLREWYGLYFPELSEEVKDNAAFAKLVFQKDKTQLMKEIKVKDSLGADIGSNLQPVQQLAQTITALYEQKDSLEKYLAKIMKKYCPNINVVAGALIGAKLLREVGSLKKMASVTSSTLQLLGAEKALFRHIRNKKAKPPKHGHIVNHPIVAKVAKKDKGKAARIVADKISLAAKVDYFKGEFIGDKLRDELEKKFK